MEEIYVIVKRNGDQYTGHIPGILNTLVSGSTLSELEQKITHQLAEKEEFQDVTFQIVRKTIRETSNNIETEEEPDGVRWVLWRQDQRGSRYQVSSHPTTREAELARKELEGDSHLYWLEPERTHLSAEDSGDIWEFEDSK